MRSIIKQDIPKLAPQKDWASVPSDPLELFFLSNVNGKNDVGAIASICSKSLEESIGIIANLIKCKIVNIKGIGQTSKKPKISKSKSKNYLISPIHLVSLNEIDSSVLSQNVDLPKERKEEILRVYHSINTLNPFQIFSASEDISDKEVKRAYQKLTLRFHPDRYYGKNLGDFGQMITDIFKTITDSYELLSNRESRENLKIIYADSFEEPAPDSAVPEVESPREQSKERKDNRRSRIKKRLMKLTKETPMINNVEPDNTESSESEPPAKDNLNKRRKNQRRKFLSLGIKERIAKAKTHLAEGKKCLAENNSSGAASHFNMALSLDPKNPEIIRLQKMTTIESNEKMAVSYTNRAKMEEDLNNFDKASRLYALASEVTDNINVFINAAKCFSKIDDHHKAKDFALRAVELSGDSPKGELCLATIYYNASMFNRANTIIVKIIESHPQNKEAKSLYKQIQRKI